MQHPVQLVEVEVTLNTRYWLNCNNNNLYNSLRQWIKNRKPLLLCPSLHKQVTNKKRL